MIISYYVEPILPNPIYPGTNTVWTNTVKERCGLRFTKGETLMRMVSSPSACHAAHHRQGWYLSLLLGLLFVCASTAWAVPFSFTLTQTQPTSAGVFATDGTLIKTLWSGVTYVAGTYTNQWDGTDDNGHLAPDGNYQIRVLSSNCTYTWEGVIGNTSDAWTGSTVFHFMSTIGGMAISGTTAYFAAGYNEQASSQARFSTTDPGTKTAILGKGAQFYKVATDGTNVYWAGDDACTPNDGFVMATGVGTDAQTTFQYGQAYTPLYGMTYTSAIDLLTNTAGAEVSGLAVQQTHPYLFVAHQGLNSVHVLNKTTGQLVQSLTFTAPGEMAVDTNDNLWLIDTVNGVPTVQFFTVNSDGTLTAGTTISGLSEPLALADNGTLLVLDGGASQQVKAFDASGTALWTYGQAGGYTSDPLVTNDKFDFQPNLEYTIPPFITYQPDGSFWVGDTGCYRIQHYSSTCAYINNIAYIPTFYSAAADPNDPTRVFANYLEFQIDYSLPLGPTNGSWTLVRNWRPGVPSGYDNMYARMKYVTTFSNGRTYASVGGLLCELPSTGLLRSTGIILPSYGSLYADGSLRVESVTNSIETWTTQALTGFDGNNNPIWGTPTTLASTPLTDADPQDLFDSNVMRVGAMTTGGTLVSYDYQAYETWNTQHRGYHLGGVLAGSDTWLWLASDSTPTNYCGGLPDDGTFDIMNGVGNAGGAVMTMDRHIIYGYRGEGWKNWETNKYRHYYEDGLFVNEFGVIDDFTEAQAGMAGNAFNDWLVELADGSVYLYHNDESFHGGVHRWKIDGLDTVAEQSIDVEWYKDTQPGLQADYFTTPDWNNLCRATTQLDAQVNFNWGTTPPPGTGLTSNVFSTRWSGYVLPQTTETYTFTAIADDYASVWVDGQQVLAGSGTQSGTIALTSGIYYPIIVEYQNSAATASVVLQWSSPSIPTEVIPTSCLVSIPAGTDLVDGLPDSGPVADGTAGWNRNPTTDLTSDYWDYWTVDMLQQNNNPYLSIFFRNDTPGTTNTVTRDLGTLSNATNGWNCTMMVNYTGNYVNHGTYGGQYMDILDDAGKIIARFYSLQVDYPDDERIYGNGAMLYQSDLDTINAFMGQWQPLRISAANGQITFQYANLTPVTTALYDPTANWWRVKTFRMYYFTAETYGAYDRAISIDGLRLSTSATTDQMDLLAGVQSNSAVNSGNYGWTVTPAPYDVGYGDWWYVETNMKTWQRTSPFDIGACFANPNAGATASFTRDLGVPNDNTTSWTINTQIDFEGNYVNHGTAGGQYLDVLDDAGNIIARFYSVQVVYPTDECIYANNEVLLQTDLDTINSVMGQWQPLTISAQNGQITFQYAGYPPVVTTVYDPSANWQRAKTLSISYWTAASWAGYTRDCFLNELTYNAQLPLSICATPTFSPAAGSYSSPQPVTISSITNGVTIRYTTDGSTPSETAGTVYSSAVTISANATLQAIAYAGDMADSTVASASYTIQCAAPAFTPGAGSYGAAQMVTISTTTGGATIRYTTDGSTPSETAGTVYNSAVNITANTTLQAIAYLTGMADSPVAAGIYTIQCAAPAFTPGAGSYGAAQMVTISTTTGGATIRYTTDGSTPTETAGTVYNSAVNITANTTLQAIAYLTGMADSPVAAGIYTIQCAAPAFTPVAGSYGAAQMVTISTATGGATIRYTTDGSMPTETAGTVYNSAVNITANTTLQAIAYMTGMADSPVTTGVYTIQCAAPTFSPAAGSYGPAQSVTISTSTGGATMRYTTDGSTPSETNGTVYSSAVNISTTATLKAIAYQMGMADSSITSGVYTINGPCAAPTFTPATGTYGAAQSVTISTTTGGATIRYTTDGSTPTETAGTLYSSAVNISANTTLKAIAYETGYTDSTVASGVYYIQCAAPSFNPAAGTFTTTASVTISHDHQWGEYPLHDQRHHAQFDSGHGVQ